jgi:NADH dehydrogenase
VIDRIAVTGASGFVGRHLVLAASARGFEVDGIVRSESGARVVAGAGGRPVLTQALEPEPLARAFRGTRAVVHLAGIGAERGDGTYETVNVEGTRSVVAAALMAGVPRVVFASGLGVARYGMTRRCTNRYFLSKLAAEVELFRSGLDAVVFRPCCVLGPGCKLVPQLLGQLAAGEVEQVGDGSHRLQPVACSDAASAILASIERKGPRPAVYDLVGPESLSLSQFLARLAGVARALGRGGGHRVREVAVEEAERRAAAGGYHGMLRDELDCLLCDQVSDPVPLESLLGRRLSPVDEALAGAVRGA